MPIPITMPALSPTMEEGTLARWLKQEGDAVSPGDVIAEIETDKATMEVEAVDEGVLGRIVVAEGTEGVKVNATIAWLLEEGEDAGALPADGGEGAAPAAEPAPAAPEPAAPEPEAPEPEAPEPEAPEPEAAEPEAPEPEAAEPEAAVQPESPPAAEAPAAEAPAAEAPVAAPAPAPGEDGRIAASPLARRMAKQAGLDLAAIAGSGPHGRVVKRDIEQALAAGAPAAAAPATEAPAPQAPTGPAPARPAVSAASPEDREIPHSNVRKVIARRLSEADRDTPQIYLSVDMEIDRLLAARKDINEALDGRAKVSVNDMAIKAAALALRQVPAVNAQWTESAIVQLGAVDVSVAVAYEGGLITPIVFDADGKGLAQIANEMKDLAGRAREGRLKPEEYQGGSFTVSNLGMYGVGHFTSIVNPPQAAILAVGAGEQKVVVRDGDMAVATVMTCTLTCDHRVIDGALGAQWLQAFKGFVERPLSMLA
ncbi:MAG: pyruvate dehydrogenase complex dihydrolipoamide acetyltransferase [Rhodospirillaceae bacterium]|nr:pyruvate dehydrogenase complex dihydrolipoamide acetyltransferase [Rhodospirillaceae bacterium]MYK13352.1 pyruvate dehydrogenase complex dihydrolipoamide acetyltransferase [Rhodospirillaceae bacterium]